MPNMLDPITKTRLRSTSSMALRQILHNSKTPRSYKTYVYAILLRRKQGR